MRRKAYLRTLEAFIAFILAFSFLIFIVSAKSRAAIPEHPDLFVLRNFEQRDDFRSCVYTENLTCLKDMVSTSVPVAYNYDVTVNDATHESDANLFLDTLYVTGSTASQQYMVRLYYWKEG